MMDVPVVQNSQASIPADVIIDQHLVRPLENKAAKRIKLAHQMIESSTGTTAMSTEASGRGMTTQQLLLEMMDCINTQRHDYEEQQRRDRKDIDLIKLYIKCGMHKRNVVCCKWSRKRRNVVVHFNRKNTVVVHIANKE